MLIAISKGAAHRNMAALIRYFGALHLWVYFIPFFTNIMVLCTFTHYKRYRTIFLPPFP